MSTYKVTGGREGVGFKGNHAELLPYAREKTFYLPMSLYLMSLGEQKPMPSSFWGS